MRAGGSATVEPAWVRGMPSARARRFSGAKCASAAVGYLGSQEGDSAQRSCLARGEATGGFHYGRVVTACGLGPFSSQKISQIICHIKYLNTYIEY